MQTQIAVVDGRHQCFWTTDGRDRQYVGPAFRTPRQAITYADSLLNGSPDSTSGLPDGPFSEAPDPVLAASAASVAPSRAVPPVAREGLPTLGL